MSASTHHPTTPHGPDGVLGASPSEGQPHRLVKSLLVGSLLLAAVSGCSGRSEGVAVKPVATPTSPAVPATATPSVQEQILTQYRTFWAQLTPISRMPASSRRAALAPYALDPELKSLLAGFAKLDAAGQILYGSNRPRPVARLAPDGATAVVNDCQDSSMAGAATRATTEPVTKGVVRNHVVVTMKLSSDVWKVFFVAYSKTPC